MKDIAGWMTPEMNWALKLDAYSASLCSSKVRIASFRRPKTFTSAWPVYISSMWPLSLPVTAHCLTNCGCARLPMTAAPSTDTGTVASTTRASSGEIQNIIASTPTMVSSARSICPKACCMVCVMLSMSLVVRERTSPRGCLSKYDRGSRASFVSACSRSR